MTRGTRLLTCPPGSISSSLGRGRGSGFVESIEAGVVPSNQEQVDVGLRLPESLLAVNLPDAHDVRAQPAICGRIGAIPTSNERIAPAAVSSNSPD